MSSFSQQKNSPLQAPLSISGQAVSFHIYLAKYLHASLLSKAFSVFSDSFFKTLYPKCCRRIQLNHQKTILKKPVFSSMCLCIHLHTVHFLFQYFSVFLKERLPFQMLIFRIYEHYSPTIVVTKNINIFSVSFKPKAYLF